MQLKVQPPLVYVRIIGISIPDHYNEQQLHYTVCKCVLTFENKYFCAIKDFGVAESKDGVDI